MTFHYRILHVHCSTYMYLNIASTKKISISALTVQVIFLMSYFFTLHVEIAS